MLLWQSSVATRPHVFVIATCIWSELIIYLLVSCNKQLSSLVCCARHLHCLYTFHSFAYRDKRTQQARTSERHITYTAQRTLLITTLPRGKWSTLIEYTLRWRKRVVWWQHRTARATLSLINKKNLQWFSNHLLVSLPVWVEGKTCAEPVFLEFEFEWKADHIIRIIRREAPRTVWLIPIRIDCEREKMTN